MCSACTRSGNESGTETCLEAHLTKERREANRRMVDHLISQNAAISKRQQQSIVSVERFTVQYAK
jgi:hypothetical protein